MVTQLKIAKDTTVHLCGSCELLATFPECWPDEEGQEFEFGNGLGDDNIIGCINYRGVYFKEEE